MPTNLTLTGFADHAAAQPGAVLIVGGPTASGKSGLALELALRLNGVIINADSMQVYRDLSVLTARPSQDSLARLPHQLYGVLSVTEICSVALWLTLARAEIAACHHAGTVPVVVGGSGLYLQALMSGLATVPEISPEIRAAARDRLETIGLSALHADLCRRDCDSAARLNPGDRQRILRAWEVLEATGRPLSHWQREHRGSPPPGLSFSTIVLAPPRAALYDSCGRRFDAMIKTGGLEEVRALEAMGLAPTLPALKALGVPELRRYLSGELPLDKAVILAKQSTRHYAKRQITWLRHQVLSKTAPLFVINQLWRDCRLDQALT